MGVCTLPYSVFMNIATNLAPSAYKTIRLIAIRFYKQVDVGISCRSWVYIAQSVGAYFENITLLPSAC